MKDKFAMMKRMMATILCLCMLLTLLPPAYLFAEDGDGDAAEVSESFDYSETSDFSSDCLVYQVFADVI